MRFQKHRKRILYSLCRINGYFFMQLLSFYTEVDGQSAWTATKSTGLVSQYAIAVMHSNLWPGAHAFAVDK